MINYIIKLLPNKNFCFNPSPKTVDIPDWQLSWNSYDRTVETKETSTWSLDNIFLIFFVAE